MRKKCGPNGGGALDKAVPKALGTNSYINPKSSAKKCGPNGAVPKTRACLGQGGGVC